jgi:hypothetical protein
MHARTLALVVALGGFLAQPAQAQTAIDIFNQDLQHAWDFLRPGLQKRIHDEATASLGSLRHQTGKATISVKKLNGINFGIRNAPGLTTLAPDTVGLRVPHQGRWKMEVDADIRVKMDFGFWRPTIDFNARLIVEKLYMEAQAHLDLTDPLRPVLGQVNRPKVDFKVKLRSRQFFWNILFSLLSPIGNHFAHKAVEEALDDLMPSLASMQGGLPGQVPGAGAPALADSGAATPFQEIVGNVDAKIRAEHMPYGTILEIDKDVDQAGSSWEDAFRNGGVGSLGNVVNYNSGGDAAIWTGHYLASQAFRYANTSDPAALDNVRHAMWGLGNLLDINGGTGLLSRNAAPVNSIVGQNILSKRSFHPRRTMHGEEWVGLQGGHGISRDQYSGVYFGMLITYNLVNDQAIKAECARRLQQMLDYKIARDWLIHEDRPAFDGVTRYGTPTFWLGIVYQQLAFLHIGERLAPGKYTAEFNSKVPLIDLAWLGSWTNGFGLDHYYKFNLSHIGHYMYFSLETDQTRWQEMARSFRMVRNTVGHHRNPHFDLITTTMDPSSKAVYFPQSRECMRQFFTRNHREVAPPVVDLSNVTWQSITVSGYVQPGGSAGTITHATVQMPSEPLNFAQRKYTGNFHWQRNPFEPATPNHGSPRKEKHGLDVVLPYWMGRHLGAF